MSEVEGKAVRVNERLCFSGALSSMRIESQDQPIDPFVAKKGGRREVKCRSVEKECQVRN